MPKKGVVPPQFRKGYKKGAAKKAGPAKKMPASLAKKLGKKR